MSDKRYPISSDLLVGLLRYRDRLLEEVLVCHRIAASAESQHQEILLPVRRKNDGGVSFHLRQIAGFYFHQHVIIRAPAFETVRQRFLIHRPERAAFFIRAKLVQVRCATRLYIFLRRTLIRNLCRRQFDKGEEMAGVPAGGSQVQRTFRFRLCCPAIRHLNFEDRLLVRKINRFRPQRRVRDQDRDEHANKTESRFSHAAIMGKSPAACRALHPESLNSYFPPTAGSPAPAATNVQATTTRNIMAEGCI